MTTPTGDPDATARVDSDTYATPRGRNAEGQFAPGTIIAGRYRIASLLGSGGMGEVYRADDTKLGQTVALKFLPARLARNAILLERLHDEVRLGRQITHPNVCRIYDIVESDGAHFVAMEHVDGEDLSRLLVRIGRLAHDKAVDIARGVAAGLMAAHGKGILHRDLKPANIMIDSRGDAHVMDFGLALAAGEHDGTISGTPAYMAPEQLAGEPASVQSDLYALGLVLYELVTGKRAHNARTMPERLRDLSSEINLPSNVVRDIDPAVERIILRCLANDPAQRPRSAREVIEALPGGDPLAAALAAGETPSPRIVAAAGSAGSLKPWQAWSLLATALTFLAITVGALRSTGYTNYVSFERAPGALIERGISALRALGIPRQQFRSHVFVSHRGYLGWIMATDRTPKRWERLRRGGPAAVTFAVYESAEPLNVVEGENVTLDRGVNKVQLDPQGRIVTLDVVPRREWAARPLDWKPLFTAAGLDPTRFTAARTRLVPGAAADTHVAWNGRHPDDGTPIHVEAAAWRGTPVFFRITGAWEESTGANIPFTQTRVQLYFIALVLSAVILGVVFAARNLRARRGDRQGGMRVAMVVLIVELTARILSADHHPSIVHEIDVLTNAAAKALLWAAIPLVLYLALEPFVRRRWPQLLIASSRLLAGHHRDPMVGRDVLIGITLGVAHCTIIFLSLWIDEWRGAPLPPPHYGMLAPLNGVRFGIAHIADSLADGALHGFVMMIFLVLFLLVLRHRALAAAGLAAVMIIGYIAAIGRFTPGTALLSMLVAGLGARYGLLMVAVAQAVFLSVFHYSLFISESWKTLQPLPIVLVLALAIWAFRTALAGQPAFGKVLDD
jgi:serine/threonine-protein kinase